jgi:hypothetical protein
VNVERIEVLVGAQAPPEHAVDAAEVLEDPSDAVLLGEPVDDVPARPSCGRDQLDPPATGSLGRFEREGSSWT